MAYTSKITKFILFNLTLLVLLYSIPINSNFLNNICIFKLVTGRKCFNCGMTRAFLSILHLNFKTAYNFNHNVIVVFPFTIGVYIYSWYTYFIPKGGVKNERKR